MTSDAVQQPVLPAVDLPSQGTRGHAALVLTIHFNKDAWDAFAKELRRASWGAAAIAAAFGLRASSGIAATLGAFVWAVLQTAAVVVQSIEVGGDKE